MITLVFFHELTHIHSRFMSNDDIFYNEIRNVTYLHNVHANIFE